MKTRLLILMWIFVGSATLAAQTVSPASREIPVMLVENIGLASGSKIAEEPDCNSACPPSAENSDDLRELGPQVPEVIPVRGRDDLVPTNVCAKTFHFTEPAHFPVSEYESGATNEVEGISVFEGMKVTCYPNGNYVLAFRTSAPRVPVTMRLQISVEQAGVTRLLFSVPALKLSSDSRSFGSSQTELTAYSQSVIYRGNSYNVKSLYNCLPKQTLECNGNLGQLPVVDQGLTARLVRSGSAVLGYGRSSLR